MPFASYFQIYTAIIPIGPIFASARSQAFKVYVSICFHKYAVCVEVIPPLSRPIIGQRVNGMLYMCNSSWSSGENSNRSEAFRTDNRIVPCIFNQIRTLSAIGLAFATLVNRSNGFRAAPADCFSWITKRPHGTAKTRFERSKSSLEWRCEKVQPKTTEDCQLATSRHA